MSARVFFIDNRAGTGRTNLDRLGRLLAKAGLASVVAKGDLVAIKLSFGERGNLGYIHPVYVRRVVDAVKKLGGRPVLMDSNTLYKGSRSNAHDSLVTALENGFSYATVGAPLLILDGLDSHDYRDVPVAGRIYQSVKIGSGIADAAALISLAHVKGHLVSGFGAQIKNLSMGAAPRSGKQMMHSEVHPEVQGDVCIGCGRCVKWCPQEAISLVADGSGGRRSAGSRPGRPRGGRGRWPPSTRTCAWGAASAWPRVPRAPSASPGNRRPAWCSARWRSSPWARSRARRASSWE